MDRAEAIRHFEYGISHDIFKEPVTSYAKMAIAALREQDVTDINVGNKWISVKERLPVGEGRVLCISPSGVYRTLDWNSTFGCWFDLHGYSFKEGVVTHWMPLPEPPKEGADHDKG